MSKTQNLRDDKEGGAPPRYYWLKLPRDFFDRADIRMLGAGTQGKRNVYIYIRLLCEGMDKSGRLLMREGVPHTIESLSMLLACSQKTVKMILDRLCAFGMLTIDDDCMILSDIDDMVGSETKAAQRMRKTRLARSENAADGCNNVQHACNNVPPCYTEIEIEKEIEKEIELERERESDTDAKGRTRAERAEERTDLGDGRDAEGGTPTREEVMRYVRERGYRFDGAHFYAYYTARGWRLQGETVADWRALADSWQSRPLGEEARVRERYGNFDPEAAFQRALERSLRDGSPKGNGAGKGVCVP